ncbi:hypothetical protein E2C01_020960 [Portunus trituberculatus]|uniref:Uncharacterized protein n=1 Tax=Portunus trituberculatus TaxID=210409 RepID=A0A5B7E358_PORTR|nr:hypothetical protein [Portunus trituberculatus]
MLIKVGTEGREVIRKRYSLGIQNVLMSPHILFCICLHDLISIKNKNVFYRQSSRITYQISLKRELLEVIDCMKDRESAVSEDGKR